MLKPRKFDIADSNIANLGSDLEKKVSFLLFFFLFFFFFFFLFSLMGSRELTFFFFFLFLLFSLFSLFSLQQIKKRKESNRDLIWGDQEERCSPLGDSFFFILEFGEFLTLLV